MPPTRVIPAARAQGLRNYDSICQQSAARDLDGIQENLFIDLLFAMAQVTGIPTSANGEDGHAGAMAMGRQAHYVTSGRLVCDAVSLRSPPRPC